MRSLSSDFASPFTPNARAMSRLVTRAGGLSPFGAASPPIKAISSSREGKAREGLRDTAGEARLGGDDFRKGQARVI
jgi:hypothetical protein